MNPWREKGLQPLIDGQYGVDLERVHIALMEFSPVAMDDPRVRDLYDMACDLLEVVRRQDLYRDAAEAGRDLWRCGAGYRGADPRYLHLVEKFIAALKKAEIPYD